MNLYKNFKIVSSIELNNVEDAVPNKSGIYMWYIDFNSFNSIQSKEDFAKNLNKLSDLINKVSYNGKIKYGNLTSLNVEASEQREFLNEFYDFSSNSELHLKDKINGYSLNTLKEIFDNISRFSILTNPLYIGMAKSLKTRSNNHLNDYYRYLDSDEKKSLTGKFGYRIAEAGFKPDNLLFCFVEADITKSARKETEFLLNRLYKPVYGIN